MSRVLADGGLDRLSEREKRVLRLLASGHSVKSAAAEEAITENAANELLRAARRKLGTGSSREAARLLAGSEGGSQEIRDEISVMPRPPSIGHAPARPSKGEIAMSLTALTAIAVVVLAAQGGWSGSKPPMAETLQGNRNMPAVTPTGAAPAGAPKVVSTSPAEGAAISPGPFTLSVTFDRPMLPQAMSVVRTDEGAFPECPSLPQISEDGRTYSMECVAPRPGTYVIYFNRPPYMNFRDARTQLSAEPARLEFTVVSD